MIEASQASLRTVSGARRVPASRPPERRAGPGEPVGQGCVVDGDHELGFGRCGHAVPGGDGAADQLDQGVRAAALGAAQVGLAVDGLGRGQRAQGRLEGGLALDVQAQDVLDKPEPVLAWGAQGPLGRSEVLLVLQLTGCPVAGQHRGPQPARPAAALLLGDLDEPRQDVGVGALGQPRAQPVGLRDHHGGGPHRQPAGLDRGPDRFVGGLAERGGQRHDLTGATGPQRGCMLQQPPGDRQRPRAGAHVAALDRVPGDGNPGGVTALTQRADPTQQLPELLTGGLPQHLPQPAHRHDRGRDRRTPLRQPEPLPRTLGEMVPLHTTNPRGHH